MNKKWAVKLFTVNLTSNEAKKLEKYCQQTDRPATNVIQELVRGLAQNPSLNRLMQTLS